MKGTNMRVVVIAFSLCIMLCLSSGLASAQLPTKKLEISAPAVANVDAEVTITVTADGALVEGAEIFANNVKIGVTDENGQLKHTFESSGPVILEAKKGIEYLPAVELSMRIEPLPTPTVTPSPTIAIPVPTIPPVYHILPVIQPAAPVPIEIEGMEIKKITIEVENEARNVNISVAKLVEKPPEIRVVPPGKVYGYFEIEASAATEASVSEGNIKATIEFKVEKNWLVERNTDKTSVRLCRYREGEWEILPTKVEGGDSVYVYFSAESSGFSTYAITTEEETPTPTPTATPTIPPATPTPTEKVPGFEAVFANFSF